MNGPKSYQGFSEAACWEKLAMHRYSLIVEGQTVGSIERHYPSVT